MNYIEVKNLLVKFDNVTAVDNISFLVPKGEIFAFLGPNGAGKTTTIKVLTTLLESTSGEVLIDGVNVKENPLLVRKKFGICFQDQSLDDDLTAYENMDFHGILYGVKKKERTKKINELFELVELSERKDDFVRNFSGGMKRRLELARALIHEPRILYLDEPTLGLDPQTRNHIWNYIKNLSEKSGMTIFFTTHYMEEAEKFADRITIIDHGKIVAEGTSDELMKRTNTISLEDAFISLTGKTVREAKTDSAENFRNHARAWGRK